MRINLIVLLICWQSVFYSQIYNDLVIYDGDTYLMHPSPSVNFTSYGVEYVEEYFYKGVYEVLNGKLVLKKILLKHKILKNDSIVKFPKLNSVYSGTGSFKLIKVLDTHKIEKKIIKTGVKRGVEIPLNLDFKVGVLFVTNCIEGCIHSGKVGFLDFSGWGDKPIDFEIYNSNNDIVLWGNTENYWHEESFFGPIVRIKPGVYKVVTYLESFNADITTYFWNVKVENSEITFIEKRFHEHETWSNGYSNDNKEFAGYSMVYGNNQLWHDGKSEVNLFGVDAFYGYEAFLGIKSKRSFLVSGGGGYSLSFKDKVQNSVSSKESWLNSYSYLTGNLEFGFRNYFGSYKTYGGQRFFVELGAFYRFPLIFRNVQRFGDQKISRSQLNNYKDLSAQFSAGFINGVALFIQYRLFDVVKNENAQLPKFQFGFSLVFDN